MHPRYWILLIFLLLPHAAAAQTGTCESALGEAYLDAGNVRARILNNGALFWRGSPHVYEIGGANAIFASTILVGGLIDNQLRTSASRYGPWEFWAGPLDDEGNPPVDCKPYDQIWEITRDDIIDFQQDSLISNNLKSWPWQLGAPVVDGDGHPNNYNLEGGDLPELLGDQRLWWIMNDRGNIHESSKTTPIGLEVHASAHAFDHPDFVGNSTFYSYTLINKNKAPLKQAFFGMYQDFDLGYFADDYVGSDSLLHLSYAYNGDDDDEGSRGYGKAPPAVGYTFLETILAPADSVDNDRDGIIDEPDEKLGAYAFVRHYGGGTPNGDPVFGSDYYRYMQGRWKNNVALYHGYNGWWEPDYFGLHKPTRFSFSGDPVKQAFWTKLNYDEQGSIIPPSDQSAVFSTGPFELAPMDTVEIRFAIVWARGSDHLDSVTELKKDVRAIRGTAEVFYAPLQITPKPQDLPAPVSHVLGFDQNFPNPFTQITTLRYSLPQAMQVRLVVCDLLGREVTILVDAHQDAGIHTAAFDAGDLPAGVYLARIELDFLRFTKRMVLLK
ncbi:MAG: T9SS type A sorting domain-containing protein [Bacteroidota bacterium]